LRKSAVSGGRLLQLISPLAITGIVTHVLLPRHSGEDWIMEEMRKEGNKAIQGLKDGNIVNLFVYSLDDSAGQ
jgi:hypothetical protein